MGPTGGANQSVAAYRLFIDAVSRRAASEARQLCAEDVALNTPLISLWNVELTGHDGVVAWIRRLEDEWAFLDPRVVEAEVIGDCVLGRAHLRCRGKGSPEEIEFEIHHAVRFEGDGRIASFNAFLTRGEAIEQIDAMRVAGAVAG